MGFSPPGGGGGGSGSIAGASDVTLNSLQNDQVLTYDSDSAKWENQDNIGSNPTLDNLPAGSTISVKYTGSWPARPTARADITVQWIDFTGDASVPAGAIENHDIVLIADGA